MLYARPADAHIGSVLRAADWRRQVLERALHVRGVLRGAWIAQHHRHVRHRRAPGHRPGADAEQRLPAWQRLRASCDTNAPAAATAGTATATAGGGTRAAAGRGVYRR
jgi:hypothetical protein